jgi:hypothetical protein
MSSTFKFDNVRAEPSEIGTAGETTVSVDVSNTGSRAGDEVAQLGGIVSCARLVTALRPS